MIILNFLVIVISYLVASINPAILVSKKVLHQDIRELGSKNAGTTNSIRTMGKKWGAVVFALDLVKVIISYLLIIILFKIFGKNLSEFSKSIYMLCSVIGHIFPLYYNFKGGKGVAVYLMSALLIDYKATLVCLIVGICIIAITRFVSLGSICGAILLVIIAMFMDTNFSVIIVALTTAIIVYKHRENIRKLFNGKESKLF